MKRMQAAGSFSRLLLLYATTFLVSLCVMTVELVAGRLVARYLGQSLYTWTAILGVVLGGMAVGNYAGGRLADRFRGGLLIPIAIGISALACGFTLPLNSYAGTWTWLEGLSWPMRIVVHVGLVFAVPCMALGAVSPPVVKLALDIGGKSGRTFGSVYTWGVIGSIAGTLLTGFVLVAVMGAKEIVLTAVGTLAALAVILGWVVRGLMQPSPAPELETGTPAAPVGTAAAGRFPWAAALTAFVVGACIMMTELAAGRMISKEFGHSLYSWTGVIAVFLAGMSVGTWLGGRLSDRWDPAWFLPALLMSASAACLLVPLLGALAGQWVLLWSLYWPQRIVAHTALMFGLCATIFGAAIPVIAAMALRQGRATGRTVGVVYAWVSLGNVAGTFLAGFWLIDRLGVRGTILAAILALAAAAPVRRRIRRVSAVWLALCALLAVGTWGPWPQAGRVAAMTGLIEPDDPFTVYRDESAYYYISVKTDSYDSSVRRMYLDNLKHSEINLRKPLELSYVYERLCAAVVSQTVPEGMAVRTLMIGGGGFTFPRYVETTRPGSDIEVVEIDPAVTVAAQKAMGLPADARLKIRNADGANYVADLVRRKESGEKIRYDFVFGDCFDDYLVPYHLTSEEFCRNIETLVAPDGVYVLIVIDVLDFGRFLGAIVNTCQQVFSHVDVLSTQRSASTRDTFVVVCSERDLGLPVMCAQLAREQKYGGELLNAEQMETLHRKSAGIVLTDDYAPVENLLADVIRLSRMENPDIRFKRALRHYHARRYDAAIAECRKAIKGRSDFLAAYDLLAINLGLKDNLKEALAEWRKAAAIRPDVPSLHNNIGYTYFRLGDLTNAVLAWETALAIDPAYTNARHNLEVARDMMITIPKEEL